MADFSSSGDWEDLYAYLTRTGRLSSGEVQRWVQEVVAFLHETAEEFIRRRHSELQAQGYANATIYARLDEEIAARRFRAPAYSQRQIRRIIYG